MEVKEKEIITDNGVFKITTFVKNCYDNGLVEELKKEIEAIEKQEFLSRESRHLIYGIRLLIADLV